MSNSVRPHRRQPTRLPCPWDSPGKNTGVDCHFLLQRMKVESESEVTQSCLTPRDPMDCSPPGSSVHGILQARVLEWIAIAFSVKTQEYENKSLHPPEICGPQQNGHVVKTRSQLYLSLPLHCLVSVRISALQRHSNKRFQDREQ